jgi:hypothetical protein
VTGYILKINKDFLGNSKMDCIFTSANDIMAKKKVARGRPKVADKRIRVSFMALESIYQKAINKAGKELVDDSFRRTLESISVYGFG